MGVSCPQGRGIRSWKGESDKCVGGGCGHGGSGVLYEVH